MSPSSISLFKKCPLQFKYRHIDKLPEPTTEALATGTVAHTALERLFTLPPPQRTAAAAEDLFRATWAKLRLSEKFRPLFFKPKDSTEGTPDASSSSKRVTSLSAAEWEHDREKEAAWGQKSLQTLRTYFEMENPELVTPVECEKRIQCSFPTIPEAVGVIDRLDIDSEEGQLIVTDYKTGSSPKSIYSAAMNEQIREEAFEQLRIYALMLRQSGARASRLRLLFLGDGAELEESVTEQKLALTEEDLRATWQRLIDAARSDAFEPSPSPLCDWCAHKSICPAFDKEEDAAAA